MILSFINIRKDPREMLKTSGFALGFQHLPRDLANFKECKIMFDPNTKIILTFFYHTFLFLVRTAAQNLCEGVLQDE